MFADTSEAQTTLWSNYAKGEVVHEALSSLWTDRRECLRETPCALLELLSPGAEAYSVRSRGGTMAGGVGASPPLCLPALQWGSVVHELPDVHCGTCSSVLRIHEVSALGPSMAGLEARILCYSCLKK